MAGMRGAVHWRDHGGRQQASWGWQLHWSENLNRNLLIYVCKQLQANSRKLYLKI
jgi:hypothetical protein